MKKQSREGEFIEKIGCLIEVPECGYFINRANSFDFLYTYLGSQCLARIDKPVQAAELLYQLNKIESPVVLGSSVCMHKKVFCISMNDNGSFVQQQVEHPFDFADADFTREEAHAICAQHHFEAASRQAGDVIEKALRACFKMGGTLGGKLIKLFVC